ncbi:MAG: phosphopantetheine-binding protein [Betaproteobacteria bacterium]
MHDMTTLESLQKLLAEKFDLPASQLQPESELDKIGLDSLAIIEFMFTIEDEFKIKMPDERVEIKTVQDIVAVVDRLVAEQDGKAA